MVGWKFTRLFAKLCKKACFELGLPLLGCDTVLVMVGSHDLDWSLCTCWCCGDCWFGFEASWALCVPGHTCQVSRLAGMNKSQNPRGVKCLECLHALFSGHLQVVYTRLIFAQSMLLVPDIRKRNFGLIQEVRPDCLVLWCRNFCLIESLWGAREMSEFDLCSSLVIVLSHLKSGAF